jgi:hypothetical protein
VGVSSISMGLESAGRFARDDGRGVAADDDACPGRENAGDAAIVSPDDYSNPGVVSISSTDSLDL